MKTKSALSIVAIVALWSASALAAGWKEHRSEKYGIRMLLPEGATVQAKELGGGWAAMVAEAGPAKVLGIAKLGAKVSAEEIEAFGVKLTGIAGPHWKPVTSGKGENGWTWYKAAMATDGKTMVAAVYGVGARGSYLILLQTTVADFKANTAAYERWTSSLRVF